MSETSYLIETRGVISQDHRIRIEETFPTAPEGEVRVMILIPDAASAEDREWLDMASRNPAFDFLRDAQEDIYSAQDGRPFHDAR